MNKEQLQKLLKRLHDDCFEAHRGAFWWDESRRIAIVFGNDGKPSANYTKEEFDPDERVDFEIDAIRELLRTHDGKELGFAVAEQAGSWAMACDLSRSSLNPDVLEGVLWRAWNAISNREDHEGRFRSLESCYTAHVANEARAVLERNGLL